MMLVWRHFNEKESLFRGNEILSISLVVTKSSVSRVVKQSDYKRLSW